MNSPEGPGTAQSNRYSLVNETGVDHEQVGGQDLIGVLADELAPAPVAGLRRRCKAVMAQHPADGQVGAAMTQLQQLRLGEADLDLMP